MTRVAMFPAVFLFAFLFVMLMVLLLGKGRKAGVGILVGILMFLAAFFILIPVATHRRVAYEPRGVGYEVAMARAELDRSTVSASVSPIWSEGVEQEFEADVYPSRLAATQAVGRWIDKSVRELVTDANSPAQITLFQEASDPALLASLRDAIQQAVPRATCAVEAYLRDLRPGELGVSMMLSGMDMEPAPWSHSGETRITLGVVHVHLFTMARRIMLQKQFVETPWIDNFATFASARPEQAFIIARSNGTCTSEGQASAQAMEDARLQLAGLIDRVHPAIPGRSRAMVGTRDIQEGQLVVDKFVQSFNGVAGKIWRQAMLIDASSDKLAWLNKRVGTEMRVERMTWARMIASTLGVFAVIAVTYFFLNMATKGYYDWSLRIAGLVLAIVGVIFIFLLS